jgi:uncharacterized membrane protein
MWMILLGHILGDYFYQPKAMAINKASSSRTCCIHCLIYTLCMFGVLQANISTPSHWIAICLCIFITHYVIDHYSLGQRWLDLIEGRNILKAVDSIDVAFSAIVYVVVDNTLHICSIVVILKLFGA